MAGIKSLAIRGIRSFGPDVDDEQRISFERPLTLILGQNGCGKTTIIECIRYAITGQMPPGSRNECFVHDAKVSRSTEVLGQVRLKLFNAKDKQLEVARSMKVTCMAKKKTKFQTLDSLLSVIDDNGETKDISSRCADLDSFMHEELGVSKAILNSVIFCHQEDSSWPLDEGKKVKERFDEIFDADRYSDCFDHLRKLRKENGVSIRLLTQEVQHLTEKKDELDKKKLDQVNTESRISESELKITALVAELTPVTEKLAQIKALEKDLNSLESSKDKAKTRIEHCQTQEQDLKKSITNIHEGTIKEIEEAIVNYATTAKEKKKELDQSYKKITSFNKDEEKIANEKQSNELKFNKLIMLESQNQERIDKRNKMIIDVSKLAEISVLEINTREEAEQGIKNITDKVKSLNQALNEERATHDEEEKKLQVDVDESRDALSRHKQKIAGKESEINNVKKQLTKLEKDINDAEDSKQKLTALEEKLKKAEDDHKAAENELNVEETQKEIAEDEKGLEAHEKELDEISEKISQLQKQSSLIKERDMVEESLKQKEKNFTVLKNKHRPAIVDLLGSMPESGFAVAINKLEADIRSEVDAIKKKLKERQIEITKLESERKHVREKLNDCRSELTKGEDKMYKACGTQSYSSTLSKLTSTVEKLQDEQNVLQSSMFIIGKYKTQLKDNNCCPLCNRGFENENEVTDLISQLTTQVLNVPAKLEKVTEELQRSSAKKDELLSMKSLDEKITKLKETDIPQLETKLTEIDKKIATANESVEELQTAMTEPELKLQTVKQVHGDMPLLDKYVQEIKVATKEVENVKAKCVNLITDLTLDDASAKKNDLRQKISTLKGRIKSAQTKINQHSKKLQKLNNEKNKLKEQLLNMQKKVQEIVNLQEKQKQLEESREQYLVELKQLQEEIPSFEKVLKEKDEVKAEAVKKNRAIIETRRAYISKITNAFDKVKTVEAEIQAHKERNVQAEMDKIKEANDKLTEKHKQLMLDRDTLTKRIDTLKDELAKQEIYKRDLEDNLKLKKALDELEVKQKELAEIEEKLNGLNKDVLTEKEELITKHTNIYTEKAQTEGQLNELKVRLKQIKTELSKNQNKDIDKKYRQKLYELHVSKAIDSDVRDYAILLEKSLMEFHREKMENINLVIRELWRKIYRGNDIDHIEIKCEGDISKDGDRRKYEYRVVQCKQGVEIDMRGRCSAGQKVLACLIIRLALAETFSSRFGILALDEPTTNLDQENVGSLCQALGEIVRERMRQKNFMFIIITHDREFIDTLGSIDKVTHYYEVGRNDEGKSVIKKIRFS